MIYAFRLGPTENDEGEAEFWYTGIIPDSLAAFRSVVARNDEDGLRRLVALFGEGQELQCEAALEKAGSKLGFVSRPMPELIRRARGYMAYGRGLGPYAGVVFERDDVPLVQLLDATALFMKAQPWRWWSDSQPLKVSVAGNVVKQCEGCIFGFGGPDYGLALYEKTGAIDRVASALEAGDIKASLKEDGVSLMVTDGPEWAAEPMEQAYGFRGLPVPVKLHDGNMAEVDPISVILLCAALEAASKLRPDNLTGSIDWKMDNGARLSLSIEAPAPLA